MPRTAIRTIQLEHLNPVSNYSNIAGYAKNSNSYHNNLHACDVLQTTHWFIKKTGLKDWLSALEEQYANDNLQVLPCSKNHKYVEEKSCMY